MPWNLTTALAPLVRYFYDSPYSFGGRAQGCRKAALAFSWSATSSALTSTWIGSISTIEP